MPQVQPTQIFLPSKQDHGLLSAGTIHNVQVQTVSYRLVIEAKFP
jgi:hypothetical protein